ATPKGQPSKPCRRRRDGRHTPFAARSQERSRKSLALPSRRPRRMASTRIVSAINMTTTVLNGSAAVTRRQSACARRGRPGTTTTDPMATEIAALMDKGVDALREAWFQRFRSPAPPIQSADILRRLFAWRLQVEAFGDVDLETAT